MSKKIKKIADLVLVAGFLGFIFFVPVMTICAGAISTIKAAKRIKEIDVALKSEGLSYKDISYNGLKEFSQKFGGVPELKIRPYYKDHKYEFVNLCGRVASCLGMNCLNDAQKLKNGFLAGFSGVRDIEESAENLVALNKFLADRGIPFIYILAPSKNAIYDVQFAPGYGDDSKQNITNMISALNAAGVKAINMDAWFWENNWHMEDVFFKTDHHWKPEAALAAARCTMDLLQTNGIAEHDEEKLREENYKKDVLKKWFLGSHGRRTGIYFAGIDDITVYYPKFETRYSFSLLKNRTTTWEFYDNLYNHELIEKKNYFESEPYTLYLYTDRALKIISNPLAMNKKRLLVLGDSFFKAWLFFLTTQFSEIHAMDLRHYSDGTFAQYIEEFKPDIVIMCINESGITNKEHNSFGVDEYLAALAKTDPDSPALNLGNVEPWTVDENKNKFSGVCGNLEANQAYTLTVDRTALAGVEHSFVQMTLQNLSTNKAIFNRYFESNSGARQKWIFTTPEGDDAYGIFLYAGTKGHTAGVDAKVEGIALRKGIFED